MSISANVDEIRWWDNWGGPEPTLVKKVTRTYAEPVTGQRELVSEVDGEGRETVWTYLDDTGFPGSKGKLNMYRSPRGDYEIYTYYNLAGPSVGQVARIYRPYKDTPDGTLHGETTLQTGRWSESVWAEDINGVGKLLASRVDKVGSTVVAKETATHNNSTYANARAVLTSTYLQHVDSNPANALTTIRQEYAEATGVDQLYYGRPYAVVRPDRTQTSWVQQRGHWSGSAFTPDTTGTAWREVEIRGSADSQSGASLLSTYLSQTIRPIYVMPGNSTLTIRIHNFGNLVREELYICSSGNAFEIANKVDREYSATGELRKETRVDAATGQSVVLYESEWTNARKVWERDSSGVKRNFTYDGKGRVATVTTEGVGGMTNGLQFSRTATYGYDAADNVVQLTDTGGQGGTLVRKWKYDLGSYLIESEEPGGRKTTYSYQLQSSGRWKVTTTLPGDVPPATPRTRIEEYYRDGRLATIGGTAEIAQAFGHWINSPSGTESHSKSPFVQHWQTDWAGRKFVTVDYLPSNDTSFSKTTVFGFNSYGQMASVSQTGSPTVRFGYNPLLGWTEEGVDMDNSGQIEHSGMDPIRTAEVQFIKTSGHWWRVETAGAFATDNAATHSENAVVETRLSGYSGAQLSEVRTKDITGSLTARTTTFDWAAKKLETTVNYPSTTNNETITMRNGRIEKVVTAQGLLFGVKYDQFGREIGRIDPRKGESEVEYESGSNDVRRVRNEANKVGGVWTTTFAYDSAGRVSNETNALGFKTYYAYSLRSELTHRWGNGTTPVRFEYNSRGQRTKMHTYRGGSGWNSPTWPTATAGTADTTEWVYAPNSGVLTEKRDSRFAAGVPFDPLAPSDHANQERRVSYKYHPDGQLDTREWGRKVPAGLPNAGQRVKTTYTYNTARQLTGKTYNDGTPSVSGMTYKRRGQLKDVTDGVTGTRTLTYDSLGFMESEPMPGGYFGNNREVRWQRDAYGRRTQVAFNSGGVAQFSSNYGYEPDKGRLSSLTTASPGSGYGTSRVTTYEYPTNPANSNEWKAIHYTWAGHDVERTLEPWSDHVATYTQKSGSYEPMKVSYRQPGLPSNATGRDALGRVAYMSRDNSAAAADYNPLFRGYLSQDALVATYEYSEIVDAAVVDRDQLTKEDLKAMVGGNWVNTDMQNKHRLSEFTYDNAQNRTYAKVLNAVDTITPNALNQPTTRFSQAVTHDLDGNMTFDGTWNYTYDAENRMTSCWKAGLTISYAYDYMGRRVEMKSNFGTWNFTKRFVWDGWNMMADLWADYGNAIGGTYVWGIDVSGSVGGAGGVGGLALMYYNGRAFIPLQDGRGNIHGYLDTSTGKNAVSWDFTAYGETVHERGGSAYYGTQDFLFRYQSKMQDMSGHLLYFGHRFYHPGMGRFPNRDPIGESGGINLYGYVANGPVNRWDFLGWGSSESAPYEEPDDDVIVLPEYRVEGESPPPPPPPPTPPKIYFEVDPRVSLSIRTTIVFASGDVGRAAASGASSTTDDRTWKPTKENCNELREQYPEIFKTPGETIFDHNDAMAASTIAAAVATIQHSHEYTTGVYRHEGRYRYTTPAKNATAVGGRVRVNWPYGLERKDMVVVNHSHAMGYEAYRSHYPDASPEDYMKYGELFSSEDMYIVYSTGIAITVHTPSHDIRILRTQASYPRLHDTTPGDRLKHAPDEKTVDKAIQCKLAGN